VTVVTGEAQLIDALRAGDERAFAALVDQHTPAMLRVARGYVPSREIAEEVVQEAWIAMLRESAGSRADRRCAHGCSPS
jgi:RNA polymerase sigma-70 factor, ECF subfamily